MASDAAQEAATLAADMAKETGRTLVTSVAMDDSWRTYVNKALGFEFRWPARGKYAPMWQVSFMDEKEGRIKNGCVNEGDAGQERLRVGAAEFCHSWKDGADGPMDWYAVKQGEIYAVIAFTKDPSGIADFAQEEYREHLDQIVSTFTPGK